MLAQLSGRCLERLDMGNEVQGRSIESHSFLIRNELIAV